MKEPKLKDLRFDQKSTLEIRRKMALAKKIKITINVDEESLNTLKSLADESGVPYQKLLNQVLRDGLVKRQQTESRIDRLEREIEELKQKLVA